MKIKIYLNQNWFICMMINTIQEHDMFAENENMKVVNLLEMEQICDVYTLEKLRDLNERLQDNQTAKDVFLQV